MPNAIAMHPRLYYGDKRGTLRDKRGTLRERISLTFPLRICSDKRGTLGDRTPLTFPLRIYRKKGGQLSILFNWDLGKKQ
jgi:hypothetical protein